MTLYSKNGSIPKDHTDGTEGWVEVPEPPLPGPGEETVWWDPPGWVVRPVEPAPVDGYVWKWSQSEEQWVDYPIPTDPPEPGPTPPPPPPPSPNGTITTDQIISGNVTI
jgi:hypothetical protein